MLYAKIKKAGALLIGGSSALISMPAVAQSSAQSEPQAQSSELDSPREKWFVTTTQCQVLLPDQFLVSVEWTGNCLNGFVEGSGRLTIKSEATKGQWTGSMKNGMAEGDGRATYTIGTEDVLDIEGHWINNQLRIGTANWANGIKYHGYFRNGVPHGSNGAYYFPNGDKYFGDFEKGSFSGQGSYYYKSGGYYFGGWKGGKKDGHGSEVSPTWQVLYSGPWTNGQIAGTPISSPTVGDSTAGISSAYGCAENGSCYGDISPLTGNPKTIQVDGYFRSDGTYVRGHYRSKGN